MHGIPKPPLPTFCPCELKSIMDLLMKGDVLFQNFKIFAFREVFCLPLLPLNCKETCNYQKDFSPLPILQKRELIIPFLWRKIHNVEVSSVLGFMFLWYVIIK